MIRKVCGDDQVISCVHVSSTVLQRLDYSKLFDRDDVVQAVCVLCLVVKRASFMQSMLAVAVLMITM